LSNSFDTVRARLDTLEAQNWLILDLVMENNAMLQDLSP